MSEEAFLSGGAIDTLDEDLRVYACSLFFPHFIELGTRKQTGEVYGAMGFRGYIIWLACLLRRHHTTVSLHASILESQVETSAGGSIPMLRGIS